MKKIIALIAAVTFLSIGFGNMAIAKNKCDNGNGHQHQHNKDDGGKQGPQHGPAPNAGDGIPDGSGMVDDQGAPNSGDGISDGSGWDGPSDNDK